MEHAAKNGVEKAVIMEKIPAEKQAAEKIPAEKQAAKNPIWQNPLPGVPDIESPFFKTIFSQKEPSPWYKHACQLHEEGYTIIDFPDAALDEKIETIKESLHGRYDWARYFNLKGRAAMRVQDAWRDVPAVKELAVNETILEMLAYFYGRAPIPFQTLNFPVGTSQPYHTDAVHFSCLPERFMCGVWLAFEDTDAENGPLYYYPKSHRLPFYTNEQVGIAPPEKGEIIDQPVYHKLWQALVKEHGLERKVYHAKKGQALIWSANLLHGGQGVANIERTRWSQVTHYYFEDCFYYTPMRTHLPFGQARVRTPFDIRTGEIVKNQYQGREIDPNFIAYLNENFLQASQPDPQPSLAMGDDLPPSSTVGAGLSASSAPSDGAPVGLARRLFSGWRARKENR